MKRPTRLPDIRVRKAFGFVNLNRLFEPRSPEAVAPALEPQNPQPLLFLLPQDSPDPQRIPAQDWDTMFRAIQVRLVKTVGDRLDSAPPPAADDAAGHVQVAVLDCVTAMAQLHAALLRERR
ncbi:hypothetical protein [Polaromonas sp. YR568]|uniref:hypothetical protein n=1 Tax=Polaromonas sp. YR568 TaxID=1855301 RepID=UPI00398C1CCC